MAVLAQDLRDAVLQAAISGKLTEQLDTDSSVKDLLAKIRVEKEQLIKLKKIKKEKVLPEIIEEDIPYEIPNNWSWLYFKECFDIKNGFTPLRTNAEFWDNGSISWFTVDDIHDQGRIIKSTRQHITEKALGKTFNRLVPPNTVLLCCTSATIGNYALTDIELTTNQQFNALVVRDLYKELLNSKYILHYVSTLKKKMLKESNSTTFPFLAVDKLSMFMIPIPPIEEQVRIVAKVEEIMQKIDEYEKIEKQLEEIKKAFPMDMRDALLQAAMQGKLTEQLDTDSSVDDLIEQIKAERQKLESEGKIKKSKGKKKSQQNDYFADLTEDEQPFEIPSTWRWVKCGTLLSVISGTSYDKSSILSKGLTIIRGGNLVNQSVVEQQDDVYVSKDIFYDPNKCLQQNDIVVVASTGSITGIGRPAFVDETPTKDLQIGAFLRIIRLFDKSLYAYMKQIFKSNYYKNWISKSVSGIGIRNLKEEHITNLPIPLPPLEEQERIVKVLNDLLPLCEAL